MTLLESCTGAQMWVAHLGLLGCTPCGCWSVHNPGNPLRRSPCACACAAPLGNPRERVLAVCARFRSWFATASSISDLGAMSVT